MSLVRNKAKGREMKFNRKRFRDNLNIIHGKSGLRQKEVAAKADMPMSTLNEYLCGRFVPGIEGLCKLSIAYEVTMETLTEGCLE